MTRTLFVLLFSLTLFMGGTSSAEAALFEPIIPEQCFCENQVAPSGKSIPGAPDWGCVMETLQNVINLAISIAFLLAIVYIIYTGFLFVMSAGSPGQREAAKTRLMNVVIGMLVVLSAWLVVDFIMRTLYDPGGEANFGPWNNILSGEDANACFRIASAPPSLPGLGADPSPGPGGDDFEGEPGVVGQGELTHSEAAALLSAAGISISSSGGCSNRNNRTCTSLEGVREDSVRQIIALKAACDCAITVTGGTEIGHSPGALSHYNGYKIDIATTDGVNAYIQGMTRDGSRNGDPRYRDRCGNEYVREANPPHWDITTSRGVCDPPRR